MIILQNHFSAEFRHRWRLIQCRTTGSDHQRSIPIGDRQPVFESVGQPQRED